MNQPVNVSFKSITVRPDETMNQYLSLIATKNPGFQRSGPDLIVLALQDYWFRHGPEKEGGKDETLKRIESRLSGATLEEFKQYLLILLERSAPHDLPTSEQAKELKGE
jgi:hypothetical protein